MFKTWRAFFVSISDDDFHHDIMQLPYGHVGIDILRAVDVSADHFIRRRDRWVMPVPYWAFQQC